QAEGLPLRAQRYQSHRLITLAVAAVAGLCLTVGVRGARQKFGGTTGPETAPFRKKELGWVEATADDIAAHAVQGRMPAIVTDHLPMLVPGTEAVFRPDKVIVETSCFKIGEIVPLPQPHSYRFTPGDLLENAGQVVYQRHFVRGAITDAEQLDVGILRLLQTPALRDVLKCSVKPGDFTVPSFGISHRPYPEPVPFCGDER